MRVNVYTQELTHEVELVSAVARDTGIEHYGLRFWMHSPDVLSQPPADDDRSAVTFWLPTADASNRDKMASLFIRAANICLPSRGHVNSVTVPPPEQDEPAALQSPKVPDGVERGPSLIGGDAPYAGRPKADSGIDLGVEMGGEG